MQPGVLMPTACVVVVLLAGCLAVTSPLRRRRPWRRAVTFARAAVLLVLCIAATLTLRALVPRSAVEQRHAHVLRHSAHSPLSVRETLHLAEAPAATPYAEVGRGADPHVADPAAAGVAPQVQPVADEHRQVAAEHRRIAVLIRERQAAFLSGWDDAARGSQVLAVDSVVRRSARLDAMVSLGLLVIAAGVIVGFGIARRRRAGASLGRMWPAAAVVAAVMLVFIGGTIVFVDRAQVAENGRRELARQRMAAIGEAFRSGAHQATATPMPAEAESEPVSATESQTAELPDWIRDAAHEPPHPDATTLVLASDQWATVDEAERQLSAETARIMARRLHVQHPQSTGWFPSADLVGRTAAVTRRFVEQTTLPVGTFNPVIYRAYWQVEFSPEVSEIVLTEWKQHAIRQRLGWLAAAATAMTCILGTLAACFRIDLATAGRYRRRLLLAAIGACAGSIAAATAMVLA